MKKNVIIAAIAATIVSLCLITACNKENSAANEEYAPAMKFSVDQMLQQRVRTIWYLTDSALRTNPDLVMAAAENEDVQTFLQITGIPEPLMGEMFHLVQERLSKGGEIDSTYPSCSDCDKHALSNFVNNCIAIRAVLNEIHKYDPGFADSTVITIPDRTTLCEYECLWKYHYHYLLFREFTICLQNCYMQVAFDDVVKYQGYLIAQIND